MRKKGFSLFFFKSVVQRKGRIVIAAFSVTLAVAVVTAMIGITWGISEKLGAQLKAYGANIIVSPEDDGSMDSGLTERIAGLEYADSVSGQVLGSAEVHQRTIEVIGLDLPSLKDRGWRLYGSWPRREGEMLAGINLRDALKLKEGMSISLLHEGRVVNLSLAGFIERGGAEDSAFIISIPDAWALLGNRGRLSTILVSGRAGELDRLVEEIRGMAPSLNVQTSRQTAVAEQSLLDKIQLLMALVTVVVLFASGICVGSTMGANVIERREEIGLMKAVGATRKEIYRFYRAEALLIGLLGGIAGYITGNVFAQATSRGAFGSFIAVPLPLIVLSVLFGAALSLLSSYFPVRDALKDSASSILRGE